MQASLFPPAIVAALVGYGSTIALVLAAATAVGATPDQTASWVLAVSLAKALGSAFLSWTSRVPVVLAWTTPGAALIAATSGITLAQAVGAFVICGLLTMISGLFRPLGQLIARIPDGVAAAMLAGILLPFCLKGLTAVQSLPLIAVPMLGLFLAVRLWNPAWAVLAALVLGLALAFGAGLAQPITFGSGVPVLVFTMPEFRAEVLLGLALPIYLVTMASQNLPGFATIRAAGFQPPVRPALTSIGVLSTISGLFGAHPVSMAAITAAICLGPDTHPDPAQRWRVGLVYGGGWLILGLISPYLLSVLAALPPQLITTLVAIALIGPLMGALTGAFRDEKSRFAATMTLVVTGAGVSFAGIGAAFWGLLAGLLVLALDHLRPKS